MSTIIDRNTLRLISNDIITALTEVGRKHGIQITAGTSHFSGGVTGDIKLMLNALNLTTGETVLDPALVRAMKSYGLTDKGVRWNRYPGVWKITQYHPSRPKYPFVCTSDLGQTFKITAAMARQVFPESAIPAAPKAPVITPIIQTKSPVEYESQF